MHLRRVLLLMAMVLLLTAVVVAVAPPRHRQVEGSAGPPPAPPGRSAAPRDVEMRFPEGREVADAELRMHAGLQHLLRSGR